MPPKPAAAKAIAPSYNSPNTALFTVLFFSFCMLCLPVTLYWASYRGHLDPVYQLTIGIPHPDKRSMVSGVLAVFGVNIIVAAFIFVAFKEDIQPESKKNK